MVDLRRAPRFNASVIPSLKSAHQIGGPEIKLINISSIGALIEIQERLLLGTNFAMQLVTAETVHHLYGRIVRCYVCGIGKAVQYRCDIAFDEDFTIPPADKKADRSKHI